MFYVYTHSIRSENHQLLPFYVGKGCRKRAENISDRNNPHHKNIVNKYGKDRVVVTKWYENLTEEKAFVLEIELIAFLRDEGVILTNVTNGGEGNSGYKWTPAQKDKKSGVNHPRFGKKRPLEECERVSKTMLELAKTGKLSTQLGKKASDETRSKQSVGIKRAWTDEKRGQYSKRYSGEGNPFYGKKHTPEAIEKNRNSPKLKGEDHPMYGKKGELNPKYGKTSGNKGYIWVTNGVSRKTVSLTEYETELKPLGWWKGRK